MQAKAKRLADGNSTVPGVCSDRHGAGWRVLTLQRWGVKQRHLGCFKAREEAEDTVETYFPRLEAAAAEGTVRFLEEFAAVKVEFRVRCKQGIGL